MRRLLLFLAAWILAGAASSDALAGEEKVPSGKELKKLVHSYLDANFGTRMKMRKVFDETFAPLDPKTLPRLRRELLKIALKHGPKLERSGDNRFYEGKRGRYIVSGKPGKALFLGLHGGGAGSGDAGSVGMGGGGWMWIYPEVLKKTEHGWTDSGTEEFVMELVEAAKRAFPKLDTNSIYISGHSMGGYGSWTLGAHHADVFGGIGPFAGAPTCVRNRAKGPIVMVQPGILPNLFNIPLHFYQSGDDKNVPPESNDFAFKALKKLDKRFPEGFNFRYDRVEGRGHGAPNGGYLPPQKWLVSQPRVPRPKVFHWQPVLSWKRQFYWVYWARAEMESWIEVRAEKGNLIHIKTHAGTGDASGLSVLLGEPLVDLSQEIRVKVNDEELFKGTVARTFSTLMMTLPRSDAHLLFDARVDL